MPRKKSQYDYEPFLKLIEFFWNLELNDISSVWFKNKKIEDELLKVHPKAKKLQINIIKSIKFSILSKGKFYYTQRELAEHFNTKQKYISKSILSLESKMGICFIRIPAKVLNPSSHQNSSGKYFPVPIKMLSFIDEYYMFFNKSFNIKEGEVQVDLHEVQVDPHEVQVDPHEVQVDPHVTLIFNKNRYLQTPYVFLYLPMYNYILSIGNILNKELRSLFSINFSKKIETNQKLISLKESKMKTKIKCFELKSKSLDPKPKRFVLKSRGESIKHKHYGFFVNSFKNLNHIQSMKILGERLDILVLDNYPPCTEETIRLIRFWNKVDNRRFSTHKEEFNKSKIFNEFRILVSHRIHIDKTTINSIENGILNFSILADKHKKLKYKKKISLLNFLMTDEWFNSCVGKSLNESISTAYAKTPDYEKSYKRVIDSFTKYFHHGSAKLARSDIDGNYYAFLSFTNQMVDDHKTLYLKDKNISEYIDMYFKFIKEYTENWKVAPSIGTYILGPKLRGQFFRSMRHEPGWETFGTEILSS